MKTIIGLCSVNAKCCICNKDVKWGITTVEDKIYCCSCYDKQETLISQNPDIRMVVA